MSCNYSLSFFPSNFTLQNHHQDEEDYPLSVLPSQDFHWFLGNRSPIRNIEGFCNLEMNGDEDSRSGLNLGYYDELKRQVKSLKHENGTLQTQNQKLEAQVKALKSREPIEPINLNKETEGSYSKKSENISGDIRPAEIDSQFAGGHPPSLPTTTTMQFFQDSSSEQRMVKEENSISNMFCGIDDQSGFWPWLDQQHYN
ncbi:BnaA07g09300D [Brassica napus]|uniref:BnaA07g09300D protein n=1 Tax=Brassica napus TaxID=3708 RepID=A0A078HNY1_BRANA|nr:BnaA07g09300D [Brassica napus]